MSCTACRIMTLLEASACLHRILQTAVIFIVILILIFSFYTPLSLAYSESEPHRPSAYKTYASFPPPPTTNWHHLSKQAISTTATDDWYLPRVQESNPCWLNFASRKLRSQILILCPSPPRCKYLLAHRVHFMKPLIKLLVVVMLLSRAVAARFGEGLEVGGLSCNSYTSVSHLPFIHPYLRLHIPT